MTPRDRILARRARFVAASLAALSSEACASRGGQPPPTTTVMTAPSTSTAAETDAGVLDAADPKPTVCLSVMAPIVFDDVHFAPGSSKLNPQGLQALDAAAETMKAHLEIHELKITGHCDATEAPCPDRARVEAVRKALVERGVEASRLTIATAGSLSPSDDNGTAEGREKNRRVELKVRRQDP